MMLIGSLSHRHLLTYQLQPYLLLLQRRQEPLAATAGTVATAVGFGHDQILLDGSWIQPDVV